MGFIAGFTGGVTLTLSLTYLALLAHKSNRQSQSSILRSQASSLDALIPPDPSVALTRRRNASTVSPDGTYHPRQSLEQYRPYHDDTIASSFLETAKSRWNAEIASAVHWAQTKDWAAVREDAEDSLARLLGLGGLTREDESQSKDKRQTSHQSAAAEVMQDQASSAVAPATATATDALRDARAKTAVVAQAVREEAKSMKEEAKEVASKGVEKAQDLVGRAKAAVYLAEEKAETKADAKLLHLSDIERALAERYDSARREERMKRSVEEVLKERYTPIGERDNSRLRGI
ncbi:hypothetical protein VTK56DRAFT_7841 [Thermocarpiscus australiensis]